ncbi:MAG: dihydroneopterin aldolase [Cyanobacteriota bacterium]|jgi:dihydroneopterin aldolase
MSALENFDKIRIRDIRTYGYTGFLPAEQTLGQWFSVDLVLWTDLGRAGGSDALEDTFDYRQAIAVVQTTIEGEKFALVERLAAVIAQRILRLGGVEQVKVSLTKLAPPIPGFGGQITVDIIRHRFSLSSSGEGA